MARHIYTILLRGDTLDLIVVALDRERRAASDDLNATPGDLAVARRARKAQRAWEDMRRAQDQAQTAIVAYT